MSDGLYEVKQAQVLTLRVKASNPTEARLRAQRFTHWLRDAASAFVQMEEDVIVSLPPTEVVSVGA